MPAFERISEGCLAAILVVAIVSDVRHQKIPNWLTFPGMAVGLVLRGAGGGASSILWGIAGIALGIGLLIIPYALGGMGAGDAKLMGCVGSFLGADGVFTAFLFAAIAGGFYAMIIMIYYGTLKRFLIRYWSMAKNLVTIRQFCYVAPGEEERQPRLRYGLAIATGAFLAMLGEEGIYTYLLQ